MKKIGAILGFTALLVSAAANAGTSTGIVSSLYVHGPNSSYSAATQGVVMFYAGAHNNAPACSGAEWAINIDTTLGRSMHSTLLTAIESGKTVTVVGSNNCNDWSDREKPYYIRLNN